MVATATHAMTDVRRGGRAGVIEALPCAAARGKRPVLAVVLESLGSTYARVADFALFGGSDDQAGWLSGGCLEPDMARHAARAALVGRIEWIEVDARDDEDVFSGGATGCRGRLRVALLPVDAMPGWDVLCSDWLESGLPLALTIETGRGRVVASVGARVRAWTVTMPPVPWAHACAMCWTLHVPAMPAVRVHGAGPETPWLVPMLQASGWHVTLIEDRSRWLDVARGADRVLEGPASAAARMRRSADAVLVMHHNFERDREALAHVAGEPMIGFIGLLGPARRRDDPLRTLPAGIVDRLRDRLHAPVGLLPTHGAEAISLSIALQLQAVADGLQVTRRANDDRERVQATM